jgi:hypothetical protein
MRINLDENEIHQALREFVENQGIPLVNKDVLVTMKAGRGANGYKAAVVISKPNAEEVAEVESTEGPSEEQQAILFDSEEED